MRNFFNTTLSIFYFEKACECSCIGFTFTVNIHKIIQYQIKRYRNSIKIKPIYAAFGYQKQYPFNRSFKMILFCISFRYRKSMLARGIWCRLARGIWCRLVRLMAYQTNKHLSYWQYSARSWVIPVLTMQKRCIRMGFKRLYAKTNFKQGIYIFCQLKVNVMAWKQSKSSRKSGVFLNFKSFQINTNLFWNFRRLSGEGGLPKRQTKS